MNGSGIQAGHLKGILYIYTATLRRGLDWVDPLDGRPVPDWEFVRTGSCRRASGRAPRAAGRIRRDDRPRSPRGPASGGRKPRSLPVLRASSLALVSLTEAPRSAPTVKQDGPPA